MPKPHIPLETLRENVAACRRCPLADGRTQTVFGVGNPHARVLFIGEAPGRNEDAQGEPFVGAAGQYLNELLGLAGLRREDVYIANILKCRPPGNRDPRPEEIQACTPYLREQTRTIDPEVLVTLGKFSTQFVLKTQVGITRLHGRTMRAGKFLVFPIFHPAAALYDGSKREALENDFVTLGQVLRQLDERRKRESAGAGVAAVAGAIGVGNAAGVGAVGAANAVGAADAVAAPAPASGAALAGTPSKNSEPYTNPTEGNSRG